VQSTKLRAPELFDFHLTVSHQTYFRGKAGADLYINGSYYRALRYEDQVIAAAVREKPPGMLEIWLPGGDSEADLAFAAGSMARLLALDADLDGFYAMLAEDPVLANAVGRLRGLRSPRSESVFEALVLAIVAQQISSGVARVIREGLVATYGTPVEADGHVLHAFPTPHSLIEAGADGLRAQKLSARKAEYILDTAERTLSGSIDPVHLGALGDEEAIAVLVAVRGIGRWTAEWVLMRALGREDILPSGDLALQRVVSELYFDGNGITEQELAAFGLERWSPYRSLVTTYLFAVLRQQRVQDEKAPSAAGDTQL
jgi:DNA-3-methyladenine glycosylase II